jgi:DNA-binding MarR family transcriptional regulator
VGYNARRAALVIIESFVREMAVHGFRPVDFSVMSVIKDNPGVTSRQLCAELNIQPPNLVGMVQTLEKRGLIERQAHPSDKRATGLHPTPAGLELMHGAERTATELETRMCAKLDLKQRTQLLKLLQAVYD